MNFNAAKARIKYYVHGSMIWIKPITLDDNIKMRVIFVE